MFTAFTVIVIIVRISLLIVVIDIIVIIVIIVSITVVVDSGFMLKSSGGWMGCQENMAIWLRIY